MDIHNVGGTLITLLTIGVLAYVTINMFNTMSATDVFGIGTNPNLSAVAAKNNFTAGIWSSISLMAQVPYLIGALALLGVVMLFGYYAGGTKMG
jgi:hypothetical protein